MSNRFRMTVLVMALALSTSVLTAGTALAAKGGGGGHSGGGTTSTGSLSLIVLNSTDGLPHYGQQVTFDVSSTAQYYFVEVDCSQAGAVVYQQSIGFYPGWPWSKNFTLLSYAWTGGAADCSALLYSPYSDGSHPQTLATTTFHVSP